MLTQATIDVIEFIAKNPQGVTRMDIHTQFPKTGSTLLNRLKINGELEGAIPKGGGKKQEIIAVTEYGIGRLKYFRENPDRVSKPRKTGARPPVKPPSNMDDEMRAHLENEARIGQENALINGVVKTVYATIIAGLADVHEVKESSHPMEKRNQQLREKLITLKEYMENQDG